MTGPLRVGVVGAGNISAQYSASLSRLPQLGVTAVCDLRADRAEALAAQHPGARAVALPELLSAPDVDLVLVLSLPRSHPDLARAALDAGKHVYVEKPLALTVAEGRDVLDLAARSGLRVGCAPDTVLGTGVQTARAVLDSGRIGTPHSATAFMTTPGHELWHPDPDFYYQPGGGPLLDMGPYYLSALVQLLGPVSRVGGASVRPSTTRTVGSGPRAGEAFGVTVDTTVTAILEHTGGALSTLYMSFDVWAARLPSIEVHGTAGSLSVPDPNLFAGPVELHSATDRRWSDVGVLAGYRDAGRGYGIADLAAALAAGRPHRAGGDIALHVTDILETVQLAADAGTSIALRTTCGRPEPVVGVRDLAQGPPTGVGATA